MFEVLHDFRDIDRRTIKRGTTVPLLVRMGKVARTDDRYYWNLIDGETVIAVTIGTPPVKDLRNVQEMLEALRDPAS